MSDGYEPGAYEPDRYEPDGYESDGYDSDGYSGPYDDSDTYEGGGQDGTAPPPPSQERTFAALPPASGRAFAESWWGRAWLKALEDTALDGQQLKKGQPARP